MFKLITTCVLALIGGNEAARILAVFPVPSISHQIVFRPIVHALVARGHDVVLLTPDPAFPGGQSPGNLTEIDVHDLSYELWKKVSNMSGNDPSMDRQMKLIYEVHSEILEKQLNTEKAKRLILDTKNNKYDLLMIEACVPQTLTLTHLYKVPTIQVSSFTGVLGNFESIGAPTHPLLYPEVIRKRIYNLTMWEKVVELYSYYEYLGMLKRNEETTNKFGKKVFGSDTPPLSELYDNIHMLFLNVHPIWALNRPTPPSVVFMGGIHQNPQRELPQDLKYYLDASRNGVVYVSFGTNVSPSQLNPEKIKLLVKVFSQLPYDVLWKWDTDILPGKTPNIQIAKWFPQSDLLRHHNIKLFITQAGLQSSDEALTAGVPLIGIPMLGDQYYNAEMYEHLKIGKKLYMDSLTEDQLREAIHTVIGDESYRKNAVHLGAIMHDQPEKPVERAVWWVEHVLRHGGAKHLRSPGANLSWTKYFEIELVLTLLGVLLSLLLIVVLLLRFLVKSILGLFCSKQTDVKKKVKRN